MAVIGLGNEIQATELHSGAYPTRMAELMPKMAAHKFKVSNIAAGLAVVENAYDKTMQLAGMPAHEIPAREPALLQLAAKHLPMLPCQELDVLVVDESGKNISGTGMDTNIIGRVYNMRWQRTEEPALPHIKAITVSNLCAASHGNGGGMGLCDVVPRKFADAVDMGLTTKHIITSNWFDGGKMPLVVDDDKEAFEACMRAAGEHMDGTAALPAALHCVFYLNQCLSVRFLRCPAGRPPAAADHPGAADRQHPQGRRVLGQPGRARGAPARPVGHGRAGGRGRPRAL
eukprot:SAG22_NODE_182_length_16036_cov_13.692226_6_plen_287_part_00